MIFHDAVVEDAGLQGVPLASVQAVDDPVFVPPDALKTWVSTASIILTHMQTLAIFSRLRLAWPDSAQTVMTAVLVTNIQLDAARPELACRTIAYDLDMFIDPVWLNGVLLVLT